jgi:hypothetical protein
LAAKSCNVQASFAALHDCVGSALLVAVTTNEVIGELPFVNGGAQRTVALPTTASTFVALGARGNVMVATGAICVQNE